MFRRPHHLGERRVKKNMKLLMMIHHDFVSVIYCFYEWFTRPQRVALLFCLLVTLMAVEATVFSTIMFKVSKQLVVLATAIFREGADMECTKANQTVHAIQYGFCREPG